MKKLYYYEINSPRVAQCYNIVIVCRQVLLRERGAPMADLQRLQMGAPGRDNAGQDGQRHGDGQTPDCDRHVRFVHAAGRGRRAAAAVPRPARQHTRAAVLLEAVLRPGQAGRPGVRRAEQPVQGDRRQRVRVPERVSGRLRQAHGRRRRGTGRQPRAHLLLYQRIVRKSLRTAGSRGVPTDLTGNQRPNRSVTERARGEEKNLEFRVTISNKFIKLIVKSNENICDNRFCITFGYGCVVDRLNKIFTEL